MIKYQGKGVLQQRQKDRRLYSIGAKNNDLAVLYELLELHSDKENIMLSCKNKCQGFDERNIPHMFERFYRWDKAHSEMREGFGLGLAIAEEIVNIHKGIINVKYLDNCVIFLINL